MYDIIIKNATIISPPQPTIRGDLAISQGKIRFVGADCPEEATLVIDCQGKYLLPGGIDPHTHFQLFNGSMHSVDDFYHGSRAALAGGTTTIIDHPAFGPAGCNLLHQIVKYHGFAKDNTWIDYAFHGVVQHVDEHIIEELETLANEGITSVKAYMTYAFRLSDKDLLRLLHATRRNSMLLCVHAEDHQMVTELTNRFAEMGMLRPYYHPLSRPNASEEQAVRRLLRLAHEAEDAPIYIVHLSTKEGLEAVKEARRQGQKNIFVETCPQYLVLDSRKYMGDMQGVKYLLCPPLRSSEDNEALWQGLAEGHIQTVGTDHCSFSLREQKLPGGMDFRKAPMGIPGAEERLSLLYAYGVKKGRISIERLAEVFSANAAQIFGLSPAKGSLTSGSDADIVIFDSDKKGVIRHHQLHSACDYTPYQDFPVSGEVEAVLSRGKMAYNRGNFTLDSQHGQFLHRALLDSRKTE